MSWPAKEPRHVGMATVVIDFDGTLAQSNWPSNEIGDPIATGVEALIYYYQQGNEIVIHTARPASHAALIWRWLTDHHLNHVVHDVVCGKPRGWLYIDDNAFNPFARAAVEEEPEVVHEEEPANPALEQYAEKIARRKEDPRIRDEQERRRQALRARAGDDELGWEAMD